MNKTKNILIKKNDYNPQDVRETFNEEILAIPSLKKRAEVNRFEIVINANKEVPFKIKKPDSDNWFIGKCLKEAFPNYSRAGAIAITWVTWWEMYSGIPMSKKNINNLYNALSKTGIFTFTAVTMKDISHLPIH